MKASEARRGRSARYRALAVRYACLFRIKPELKAEYKKAHDEIWPDIARAIRKSGIRNYSIYFRDDGTLFSYLECRDPGSSFAYMAGQEVNGR
jgi:L-rhamnose mutarotase